MEKKTKNIVLVCLGLVLILLIVLLVMFFLKKSDNKDDINNITTTTTTTTQKADLVLESSGIELVIGNSNLNNDTKLYVDTVDVALKNETVLAVYDITLKDSKGNVITINNANIKISIPYENKDNYTKFKVLYLNDSNEVLESYNANYVNGKVVFNVNHLSRYAIVLEKDVVSTTTKKKTSKKTTSTTKTTTTTTKQTTTAKPTTKPTTQATTKVTTTKKVKTYTYQWSVEGDQAGKYHLYVVDNDGNKVAGTVTLTSKATGESKTFEIPVSGRLFVKDNYTVSNAKGN